MGLCLVALLPKQTRCGQHKAIASCFVYRDTRVLSTELANIHASDIRDATLELLAWLYTSS